MRHWLGDADEESDQRCRTVCVNLCIASTYLVLITLFVAATVAEFVSREPSQAIALVRATDGAVPPIPLVIATECVAGGAYDDYDSYGSATDSCGAVEIRTTFPQTAPCEGAAAVVVGDWTARVERDLCYSPDYADGVDVWVPFPEADAAYGEASAAVVRVTITSPANDLFVYNDVEPHQRKTIFINQLIKETPLRGAAASFARQSGLRDPGGKIRTRTQEPYQADLFYDGKNAGTWALLQIRSSQFANVVTVSHPGSWLSVFGVIGGANVLLFGVMRLARGSLLSNGRKSILQTLGQMCTSTEYL